MSAEVCAAPAPRPRHHVATPAETPAQRDALTRIALYERRHIGPVFARLDLLSRLSMAAQHLSALDSAREFPSIVGAPGFSEALGFCPATMAIWAAEQPADSQALHAARCVLTAWNMADEWACGHFRCKEALAVWDREHVEAFERYARMRPWLTISGGKVRR